MNRRFLCGRQLRIAVLGAVALFASSIPGRADAIFKLTDGTNNVQFTLPNPTTLSQLGACSTDPDLACAFNVPINVNGNNSLANYIAFYNATNLGGLTIFSGSEYLLSQYGTVLFTGPLTMPAFNLGNANLFNYSEFDSTFQSDFSLSVTSSPAIPEPSTVALLGCGFALIAGIMRRRLV